MWNQRDLKAPPLVTLKSSLPAREVQEIRKCLEGAKKCLSVEPLGPPAARISRLIARMSSQFRSTVGFKALRKMNVALLRAKEVKMTDCIDNILACFPGYVAEIQGKIPLPSRQYFQYVLLRMMGFAKILCRIVYLAKDTARFFLSTMNLGHFMELITILLATVAEVWKNSKKLCRATVQMYSKMHPMRKHFSKTDQDFLKGFNLPNRLDEWLGEDWDEIIEEEKAPLTPKKPEKSLLEFSDEEEEPFEKLPEIKPAPTKMEIEEETGIPIDRKTLSTHTQHSVMDRKSLTKFLEAENNFRLKKDPKSLTLAISKKKWRKFQQQLEIASNTKSKTDLLVFFKVQWTKLLKN
ncbi:uncharacterized protein LOC129799151 [Phlebotomus papatasi]|uniref:uncharacterized protein LOC129799151 n=1 Tax=Phlebotomus papatasi TaxID=29031 RepID=UPI0024837ACA|nr:uncharacterized protein LOC129799151 [Phlebotomus papatasi]